MAIPNFPDLRAAGGDQPLPDGTTGSFRSISTLRTNSFETAKSESVVFRQSNQKANAPL
jgi:hypothetical protein